MDALKLTAGLLLPWLLGMAALLALRDLRRPPESPGEIAWIAGAGYLAGAFLLTLWMRALSVAGAGFSVSSIAGPLVLATAALAHVAWRNGRAAPLAAARSALRALFMPTGVSGAARIAWQLLLAWLVLRYRAAGARTGVAAALSVGRVDAMGDQGARLVRTRPHRSLRARRRVVRGRRRRLDRRGAGISADDSAAAGVVLRRSREAGTTR